MEIKIWPPGSGDRSYEPVRIEVFIEEQKVPPNEEFDGLDRDGAWHVVCYDNGVPVATGRYIDEGGGNFRLGRIAVCRPLRGTGLGRRLVREMMDGAWKEGAQRLLLSAQVQAIGFYEKLGFSAYGEVYDECGIPHQAMGLERTAENKNRESCER